MILTGAGVSQESGIPTFRDALTGLWSQFEAERLATPAAFKADLALVWGWYEWRRAQVLASALVAQINADTTTLDSLAAVNLRSTAAQILPELVARAFLKTGESGRLP